MLWVVPLISVLSGYTFGNWDKTVRFTGISFDHRFVAVCVERGLIERLILGMVLAVRDCYIVTVLD